jgi:hypothetical protein
MPVESDDQALRLSGFCTVEEAETVLEWILQHPQGELDLVQVEHIHTAVLQVLLAAGMSRVRLPQDPFLRRAASIGLPPGKEENERNEDSARCR